jgi:hypothetical protein
VAGLLLAAIPVNAATVMSPAMSFVESLLQKISNSLQGSRSAEMPPVWVACLEQHS